MRHTNLKIAPAFFLTIVILGGSAAVVHRCAAADQPAAEKVNATVVARIGASRFRASEPIGDARYVLGGRRIIGNAGSTLYVWDAADGSLLRTIRTTLAHLEDPTRHNEAWLAFAAHPSASRVACGGVKDGKTYLQIWDYETGKLVAEKACSCDALKALAWTPDGKRLLERANVGWEKPTGWKLVVRDEKLDEVRSHDLPRDFGKYGTVMYPLPGGEQVILWQSGREPTVFDLASGAAVRTIPIKQSIPSDLALSPDGKTLLATSTEDLWLVDFSSGEIRKKLPVLRDGWQKPRPLFSPDGKTVYVWDFRPIAYDVATGKEKWKPTFCPLHTVRVKPCDVSPDGTALLVRHGHALSRLDARTGTERDPPDAPTTPPGLTWSPDGKTLYTRANRHDRTWTAWDAASGRRLHDLLPTGFVKDDNWKMLPDLHFLGDGKECVAGLEMSESTERAGPKVLLVFDTATGRCLRRLGEPLPDDTFQWMYPIAVDPGGASVVMQKYTISGFGSAGYEYAAIRWDPVKKVKLQEWTARGHRTEPPRHYAPYVITFTAGNPDLQAPDKKLDPARINCYALADGKLTHELHTEHAGIELDRIQGNFLLAVGYESKWIPLGHQSHRFAPQPPFVHDLWELPTRAKVRLFKTDKQNSAVLGPGGQYIIRVLDDTTSEVFEPFVLKRAVATIATPCRPTRFEFSSDGSRVAVALSDASIVVWDVTPWRKLVGDRLTQEAPANLTPLWDDLGKDPATGLRAGRLLAAAGDRAVALLKGKIETRKAPDEVLLKRLIVDLDSPVFATREKAENAFRDLGGQAEPHLRKELRANPSLETRRRIERLLQAIDTRQFTAAEVREMRAVQALVWINTDGARALLKRWAQGDPSAMLTKAAAAAGQDH